jgi:hypothetical protein
MWPSSSGQVCEVAVSPWHASLYARTISHVLDLLRYLVLAAAATIAVGFAARLAFRGLRRRRTVPVLFAVASVFVALLAGTSIVGMIANMP